MNQFSILLAFTVIFGSFQTKAQIINDKAYFDLLRQADSLYSLGDYGEAINFAKQALRMHKTNVNTYNLACYYSLQGQKDSAFHYLSFSLTNSWSNCYWLKNDPDLDLLRSDDNWNEIVKHCEILANIDSTLDKSLQFELQEMRKKDQIHRRKVKLVLKEFGDNTPQMDSLRKVIDEVDKQNLDELEKIISIRGLPGKSLVGEAYPTAFLIIQHADVNTQLKYLNQFEAECNGGEFPHKYLALLTDRILMHQEKNQLFGTQLRWNSDLNNYELFPIEDPINLETRRKDFGLMSIHTYLNSYGLKWEE